MDNIEQVQCIYSRPSSPLNIHRFPKCRQINVARTNICVCLRFMNGLDFTPDVCQPWMNYVNNGNKYLIIGAVVSSEYSDIWYLHLIFGKVQKFVSGDKNDF